MLTDVLPTGTGFGDKVYSFLKWLTLIALPAFGAAYFSLADTWNLPNPDQVVGTVTIFVTLLGALLGISARNYETSGAKYDGALNMIEKPDGGWTYSLDLNDDVDNIQDKRSVTFEIKDNYVQ